MTSDEVKQLREAAEYVLATNDEITDDSRAIVASFARSLVGTDGEFKLETNIEQLCSECKIKRASECSNIH